MRLEEGSLRKVALAVGLVVILGGLVSLALARYTIATSKTDRVWIQGEEADWTISRAFNASETIGFSFRPDADWSIGSRLMYSANLSGEMLTIKYLEASITGPQLKKTTVRIPLAITVNAGATGVQIFPDYYEIFNQTTYEWDKISPSRGYGDSNGSIAIERGYPYADDATANETVFQLGKTSIAGRYSLSCALDPSVVDDYVYNETTGKNDLWIHEATEPPYLAIYRTKTFIEYPYAAFLPAGASVSVVGAVVAAWGARSDGRKARHARLTKETRNERKESASTAPKQ